MNAFITPQWTAFDAAMFAAHAMPGFNRPVEVRWDDGSVAHARDTETIAAPPLVVALPSRISAVTIEEAHRLIKSAVAAALDGEGYWWLRLARGSTHPCGHIECHLYRCLKR